MFITFEGPDGCGKSTQAKILFENLKERGIKTKLIHFPRYDSKIGKFIKSILDNSTNIDFKALQMLYVADQLEAVSMMEKWIEDGYIVIADRYDLSTIAYYIAKKETSIVNGYGVVSSWQEQLLIPDATFIFDFKGNILKRRNAKSLDMIEKDEIITKNINSIYKELYNELKIYGNDYRKLNLIDASMPIGEISNRILNYVYKEVRL